MSHNVVNAVLARRFGSVNRKAVAHVLADHADGDTWSTLVGQERIAAETELSTRTVQRVLNDFESAGLITRHHRYRDYGDGGRTSDEITLVREAVENLPSIGLHDRVSGKGLPDKSGGVTRQTGGGYLTNEGGVTRQSLSPQEPSVEPSVIEPSVEPLREARARNPIWDALVDNFGEPTTRSAQTLRGKIVASLKDAGATPDEIHQRIQAWPFHFDGATLTETALEKHWDRLGRLPARASPGQIKQLERQQRALHDQAKIEELNRQLEGTKP